MAKKNSAPLRKRPRQARAQVTLETVIQAAERVLTREGVARLTTNRIAEAAGVSVGSVYQYFPDKGAIVAALAERYIRQYLELFTSYLESVSAAPLDAVFDGILRALILAARAQGSQVHLALYAQLDEAGLAAFHARVLERYVEAVDRFLSARTELTARHTPLTAFLLVHAGAGVTRAWAGRERTPADDEALISEASRLLRSFLA